MLFLPSYTEAKSFLRQGPLVTFIIAVYLDLSSSRGGGFFCGLSLPLQGRWHGVRLPLPLGEVAVRSEDGEGERRG